MEKLFLVMPAYNEEENIAGVVRSWAQALRAAVSDWRIIVADSGSTDGTHATLLQLADEIPELQILSETDRYHGPKLMALYGYALSNGADWVFQTDSDGQTDPAEFAQFWNMRDQYDVILGNRTIRGDGKQRAFVEKVVCFLLRIYFGVKVPDANAPFRLMKASVLKKYLGRIRADFNIPNIILTAFFARYNEKLCFIPISFAPRTAGVNSVNILRIIKIGFAALKDFAAFKKDMKKDGK